MITSRTHKLYEFFPTARDSVVRVTFKDGEVYRLSSCYAVDETVYDKIGLWCGEVIEIVKVSAGKKSNLHVGSGMDFFEEDITETYDEASQQLLFKC